MHGEEGIFVGPVLASDAGVLLRADVQGEDGSPYLSGMLQQRETPILRGGTCLLSGLHESTPCVQVQYPIAELLTRFVFVCYARIRSLY